MVGFTHRPKQKVINGELEITASAGVMSGHGCSTGWGQRKETKERRQKRGPQNMLSDKKRCWLRGWKGQSTLRGCSKCLNCI